MSDWEDVRGYGVGVNPTSSTISMYLYCGGTLLTKEENQFLETEKWKNTTKYKVEYSPANAAIAIDLLRNEKSIVFNPKTERLYVYAQESGVGEEEGEKIIKT
ncbi:MAG: hypothetical protein CL916_02315 [Deltaproteobacteria bacterium]|nr:hypothetical protein [Deltaproteobacteria bacterium]